jgi:hypothetical protein
MEALSERAAELRQKTELKDQSTGEILYKPQDPPMTVIVTGGWTSYIETPQPSQKAAKA